MAREMLGNDLQKAKNLPWRERPHCHFTWNLKIGIKIDCDRIIRNIDHDLTETQNLLRIEGLLFRAYLEVWDNRKRWDVCTAREFLDESDNLIKQADCRLQKGYKVVALLNRMWIEHKCQNTPKVKALLLQLDSLTLEDRDFSVIGAVRATALTRLGPTVMATALGLFEVAIKNCKEKVPVGFLYGAGLATGRMARYRRIIGSQYKKMDKMGKTLMDRERYYWNRMVQSGKDEYHLANSALGLNLSRRGKNEMAKGFCCLRAAYEAAPTVQEVVRNLARYYKDRGEHDKAIEILKSGTERGQDSPESHCQLAMCYIVCAKKADPGYRDNWNRKALEELEKCLALNKGHSVALMCRCTVQSALQNKEKAEKLYEDCLQQSEHWTTEDRLLLYIDFAKFLEYTSTASRRESLMDMWQKVMDITVSLEYLDEIYGEWKVTKKAKKARQNAYEKLCGHYQDNGLSIELGILRYQNFKFEEAKEVFLQLNPESDLRIPLNLSLTYLKMGRQKELQTLLQGCSPQEATQMFEKAHDNAVRAMEIGLSLVEGGKLRADTALAIAHNQLLCNRAKTTLDQGTENRQVSSASTLPEESQNATTLYQDTQHTMSTPTTIQLDSLCIQSYREAVRCGSLVASLELIRLIQNNRDEVTSRWTFLQMLAEIDVCCSLRSSDCLHKDQKPLTFEHGLSSRDTDKDVSALNCKTIKRDGRAILDGSPFFRQAWEQHFSMEKKILKHRFENNEGELELDGREELEEITSSDEIIRAAADCCLKLRPLLDGIVDRFRTEELGLEEETKNQYFPLILDEQNAAKIQSELKKRLNTIFSIDVDRNYPELWNQLLKIQPGYNSGNEFLKSLCTLVNKMKHRDVASSVSKILGINKDPVTLARKCTDKVEEICNFFLNAMREASDLRESVEELVSDIKDGRHEKADELLKILSSKGDFVVRMGSTWKLLEMTALIRQSKRLSRSPYSEAEEALRKLIEGTQVICQKLWRHHQEVEDAVLENHEDVQISAKCRETCTEAVKALDAELAKHQTAIRNPGRGTDSQTTKVAFPFLDICPDAEPGQQNEPGHLKGKVKKQLKKALNQMSIPVKITDKLLEIILQAQPCVCEDIYGFIAVKTFISEGSNDGMVKIKTCSGDDKSFKVLDLTRWCTDNTEKVLLQMQSCQPASSS